MTHVNPDHTRTVQSCFSKTRFIIIRPSAPRSSKWSLLQGFLPIIFISVRTTFIAHLILLDLIILVFFLSRIQRVFIHDLFNDVFLGSDDTASNDRIIGSYRIAREGIFGTPSKYNMRWVVLSCCVLLVGGMQHHLSARIYLVIYIIFFSVIPYIIFVGLYLEFGKILM